MKEPLISIIIPVYNRADFFKKTIQSVANQNSDNWECIVVDDGSDEEQLKEIKNSCSQLRKVKFLSRPNTKGKGACSCRNYGAEHANSEYIVFLDSDDIIGEHFVEKRVKVIKEKSSFHAWIFPVLTFNEEVGDCNTLWNELDNEICDIDRFLNMDLPWQTTSVVWKKEFFNKVEGFDERLDAWQDWEIHLRALILGLEYFKVEQQPDIFYRKNSSDSISRSPKSSAKLLAAVEAIKNIQALLEIKELMNKRRQFLLKKLLFNLLLTLNDLAPNIYNEVRQYMIDSRLFSFIGLKAWEIRASSKSIVLQKAFDKFYYKFKGEHFLDSKTTFFKFKIDFI